ncbi:MAG: TatD family hydrolase [Clostridia bacterium]|nr:TatD family hydrolase [Clostridia bacterium]
MYPLPVYRAPKDSIIDSHAHFNDERFAEFRDEILNTMREYGVKKIINCGTDYKRIEECLELSRKYDFCFTALAFHPSELPEEEIDYDRLYNIIKTERVVAVGETGLDYYWCPDNKERQQREFINHIKLAEKANLPIIVHDRDAHADTLEILKEYKPKGVVHCFSGSVEMAKEIVKLGMYIGIGGVLTFKNGRVLKEVAREIPIERILLETDAPYMAPEPFRGKTNHSALIIYVAEALAEIKGISVDEVLKITAKNTEELFGI